MRSNCTFSHYDFFPTRFIFFVPLGLRTVKEHQNKQRRSRGNERLQCFENTGVLTTHAIPCQLAGVKGDRLVDRRKEVNSCILNYTTFPVFAGEKCSDLTVCGGSPFNTIRHILDHIQQVKLSLSMDTEVA